MKSFSIGRDENNQIILNGTYVSRRHAELIISDAGQIILKDLGSSNGTFVNGNRISEVYLAPGDVVNCANSSLNWQRYTDPVLKAPKSSFQSAQPVHLVVLPQPEPRSQSTPTSNQPITAGNHINPFSTGAFWGSILVIVGFFLPWLKVAEVNGANIARFIANSGGDDSLYSVLFYLFPASAAIFLLSAITGKVSSFAYGIRLIPVILLIITIIVILSKTSGGFDDEESFDGGAIFQWIGIGFILTIIGSIMMCFYPRKGS